MKQMFCLKSPADHKCSLYMYLASLHCTILSAELLRNAHDFYFFFFNWTYCEQLKGTWVLWSGSWNQRASLSVATMTLEILLNLSVHRVLTGRMEKKKCKTSLLHMLELLQSSCSKGLAFGNLQIQLANGGIHPSSAALCKVFIH